jgi:hypothetical protein
MKVTLTNDFHGTSVTLCLPASGIMSKWQMQRARKLLCGIAECTCGGEVGERGRQPGGNVIASVWYSRTGEYCAQVVPPEDQ